MTPVRALRALLMLAAGIIAVVLALVVVISHPHDEIKLLAWGVFSAGVGLIVAVVP